MPNNYMFFSFLLTILSGISTLIGYFFIYIKGNKNNIISSSLGFASGIMITISIIDLIPNAFLLIFKQYSNHTIFIILMAFIFGIIVSSIIDKKIEKRSKNGLKLYKLGIITMVVIVLHNIPEGIATFITANNNIKLGITLTIAIALHNIPEGISISIPIYYATKSKFKSFLYTFISGMSEPLGALLAYLFLTKYVNDIVLGIIYSFIAGMMINIAINELFKEANEYNRRNSFIYFIVGMIIMVINHIFFG